MDFLNGMKMINKRHSLIPLFKALWNSLDAKNKKKAQKPFDALMKKVLYDKRVGDK